MSKLNIDQKNILNLLSDPKADFLIPDYQRPYAWGEDECKTLWEDIVAFAIPEEDQSKFNTSEEYFLGPIVTFKNKDKDNKLEIIDGQQRLTTIMLLLRAFYEKFRYMKDKPSIATKKNIEKCVWKTDEYDEPDFQVLKIDSEVATDKDKEEFLQILCDGLTTDKQKSLYAKNFNFFTGKIAEFINTYPTFVAPLATRILKNCILLPIEAESQDSALRIFSTLNDRGKPLADADIFKAQFYKYYSLRGEKDRFIKRWKDLEEKCNSTFISSSTTPMDEVFTRYMYFLRAKDEQRDTTTEGLRRFYEKDDYSRLKNDIALSCLEALSDFWHDIYRQNDERFSENILRKLFVLHYAPNGMWLNIVSVYFLSHRDKENKLDEEKFSEFLSRIIGFIWAYALTNPGVNALRKPFFNEMLKIVKGEDATFEAYRFDEAQYRSMYNSYNFFNQRAITKSMVVWWSFMNPDQQNLDIDTSFEIEHIYARKRQEVEKGLIEPKNIESLGNKVLLEKRVNIRAADFRFAEKKPYYLGTIEHRGKKKEPTKVADLIQMANSLSDFAEEDIINRNQKILDSFIAYLRQYSLIKE